MEHQNFLTENDRRILDAMSPLQRYLFDELSLFVEESIESVTDPHAIFAIGAQCGWLFAERMRELEYPEWEITAFWGKVSRMGRVLN